MRCVKNVKIGKGDIDIVCVENATLYIIEHKRINPQNKYNYETGTDPYSARKILEKQVIKRAKLVVNNLEKLLNILEEKFGKRPIITSVEIYGVEFERRRYDMVVKILYLGITPGRKPERFYIQITPYVIQNSMYHILESLLYRLGIRSFIKVLEESSYKGKTIFKEISTI